MQFQDIWGDYFIADIHFPRGFSSVPSAFLSDVLLISWHASLGGFPLQQLSVIIKDICLKQELSLMMVFKIQRVKNDPSLEMQFKKDHKDLSAQELKRKASSSQSSSWWSHSMMFPRWISDGVSSALESEGRGDLMSKGRIMALWLIETNGFHASLIKWESTQLYVIKPTFRLLQPS